jgi:hypothetical protein
LAKSISARSSGRGKLPVWVVRIRSLLRFIARYPLPALRLYREQYQNSASHDNEHEYPAGARANVARRAIYG